MCPWGGYVRIETFLDAKLLMRGILCNRYRAVCSRCGEGWEDIFGSSSKELAAVKWRKSMQEFVELADEFGVDPKIALEKMNHYSNNAHKFVCS